MTTVPFLIVALVAASMPPQSGKPLSRADFKSRQIYKYRNWDLNRDGVLLPEEMVKARPRLVGGGANSLDLARGWLAAKDANGDGRVTTDEAVASEMPRFDQMDINRDDRLSSGERAGEAQ